MPCGWLFPAVCQQSEVALTWHCAGVFCALPSAQKPLCSKKSAQPAEFVNCRKRNREMKQAAWKPAVRLRLETSAASSIRSNGDRRAVLAHQPSSDTPALREIAVLRRTPSSRRFHIIREAALCLQREIAALSPFVHCARGQTNLDLTKVLDYNHHVALRRSICFCLDRVHASGRSGTAVILLLAWRCNVEAYPLVLAVEAAAA